MTDITCRRPAVWKSAALTDTGCVRKVNEDSIFSDCTQHFWAVADGMGGHHVGDVASKTIVDQFRELTLPAGLADSTDAIEDSLIAVNASLLDYGNQIDPPKTVGSTVVLLHIVGHVGMCMWVGDSRLYRLRNGRLTALSRDHSQVEELLQRGAITPEQAIDHPHKNVITRAVGAEETVYTDSNVFNVIAGDTYLLCSDGLYNAVDERDLATFLSVKDADNAADLLMQMALDNGARDNVSVIVVKGTPGHFSE